jgi:hypothetical protein
MLILKEEEYGDHSEFSTRASAFAPASSQSTTSSHQEFFHRDAFLVAVASHFCFVRFRSAIENNPDQYVSD